MKSSLTKNAMKFNGLFKHNTAQNTKAGTLYAAVLLSVFSSSAFASRPAMENSSAVPAETETQAKQVTTENRPEAAPEPEAPSAVEVMMQQQNQQPQHTGDVVQLPAKEMQPGETLKIQLLDYPRRGMSMDRVQQEYGQPMATSESIGQPPITHWTYSDRVVYFEYSTVLHVVAR
ncbi:MAG: hypothetical protein GQ550_01905 [Gammaproteobacteria bacterium]|nr:hypothetical protein [Gammaproteobacteria bacterium]